jgi:SNF family Na+-dependent transporter
LTLVAFLSAIAAIEVFVAGFSDRQRFKLSRDQAVVIALVLLLLMMLPSALYPPFIGWADLIFGSGMMVTGGLLAIVALTWRLGRSTTLRQIFGGEEGHFAAIYYAWLRWVIPIVLLAILIGYIQSVI